MTEQLVDAPGSSTSRAPGTAPVTVLVPAYNEAATIADTLRSLQTQTITPAKIIVIDDCSTDQTAAIARRFGVTVMTPPANTGSKAGAQNFALGHVATTFTIALDADTVVAPDGLERLLAELEDPDVAAACGFVLPRYTATLWERGRYVEYLYAFGFLKQVQDYYGRPLISSGCFSAYRTAVLLEAGGWQTRTLAEDMDLTWTLYRMGHRVRFVPDAQCYPVEPHDLVLMRRQLRRWSHGFLQNVRLHWRGIRHIGYLRMIIGLATWDALLASLAYLVVLPVLAVLVNPLFLLGYIVDIPVVAVPVLATAARRGELGKALVSLPAFFVLRILNGVQMVAAAWREFVLRRPLLVYEKGH